MGLSLKPNQVAFRMNLVCLEQKSENEILMVSHSSGDISTEEAVKIVESLKRELENDKISIYPGVAYRHLLVWEDGPEDALTIPPHDVLDQNMARYLNHASDNPIPGLIRRSWPFLKDHPVNRERKGAGLKEANSIWLWGQGRAPKIPVFHDRYGLKGGVISAVDLIKGIGIYAGFTPIHIEGATGFLNTNYQGKAQGALQWLKDLDLIFIHVEAPDEASHSGHVREKIQAIENIDQKILGTVLKGLESYEDYRIMIISDHLTPISQKTHTSDPTPFAWATKNEMRTISKGSTFTEKAAKESGLMVDVGHELMKAFLSDL